VARIDAFPEAGRPTGLLGRASGRRRTADAPHARRSHAHQFRDLRLSELEGYVTEILTRSQGEHFSKGNDLDFSYVSSEGGRFRVNVYRKETGIGATFRPFRPKSRRWKSWPSRRQ